MKTHEFHKECNRHTAHLYPPRYGALELSVDGHCPATVLIREHRPSAARQHRIELRADPVVTRLREGAYTAVVYSPGFRPERRFTHITHNSTEKLHFQLKEAQPEPYVSAQDRLSRKYSVRTPTPSPKELKIQQHEHVILGREDSAVMHKINIESAQHLKQVIGTPNHYFVSQNPVFGHIVRGAPKAFDFESPSFEAQAAFREYIDGNSASLDSRWEAILNQWITEMDLQLSLSLYTVVDVGPWAVLEVGNASNILLCDLLRVHTTGIVRVMGDQPVHIDIGSYEEYF